MPDAIDGQQSTTQVGYDDELLLGQDPGMDDNHADKLPGDGFQQFVQKYFCFANQLLHQLFNWLVSDNIAGEDVECDGRCGYTWSAAIRPVGCTVNLLYSILLFQFQCPGIVHTGSLLNCNGFLGHLNTTKLSVRPTMKSRNVCCE